ncbi:MAG: DNA-processing protein DprA [Acidiferrobacteraceae bacterium]
MNIDDLAYLYTLKSVPGFGPQRFKQLYMAGRTPEEACHNPSCLPFSGKSGERLIEQVNLRSQTRSTQSTRQAEQQIQAAETTGSHIITDGDARYPQQLFEHHPVPVLYLRGGQKILSTEPAVACIGSRTIRSPYREHHQDFVDEAILAGFTLVSGFARGADIAGHQTAVDRGGDTICVLPSGLDRPFPPEHETLWRAFLERPHQVVFVSPFPFGTSASRIRLLERNALIVALARGVLISQASETGGSMATYRLAIRQAKPVATFAPDTESDTTGNRRIASTGPRVTVFPLRATLGPYREWLTSLGGYPADPDPVMVVGRGFPHRSPR